MSSVLITGATGFIGLHLTELFLENKFDVTVFIRKRNQFIDDLEKRGVKIIIGNFELTDTIKAAVENKDIVIHNAGATMAISEQEYIKTNAQYTRNILDLLTSHQKFILISSQAAAGPSTIDTPIPEDTISRPVSYYGKSKLLAEKYVADWGAKNNNNYIIIRPCSVFGPGDKEFFPFFKSVNRRIEPIITGGVQRLSFIYVKDLIRAILAAAESKINGEIYFVANDELYDSKRFGEEIKKALNIKFILKIFIPLKLLSFLIKITEIFYKKPMLLNSQKMLEFKQTAWLASNAKIKKELAWKPLYTLDQAVKETADWLLQNKLI
ncbi:MAG TPA: hypothetical protein DD381_00125 [Lentisphaeria bacterium]|nr:MAG: hypothetical protein A2X47_12935 [Lentisphaerae bacterium GWF2_38_69]HBM14748.1 hypothetical protein [Lentisphaeria bacterium]